MAVVGGHIGGEVRSEMSQRRVHGRTLRRILLSLYPSGCSVMAAHKTSDLGRRISSTQEPVRFRSPARDG